MTAKPVYTLTFHGVLNHGAVLQAYALQNYILSKGFVSEIINYKPWYLSYQVLRPAKGIGKTILKYKRLYLFKQFTKKHLTLTTHSVTSQKDFRKLKNYSAVVCGSDQIWNKFITGKKYDPVFFLNFAPKNVRKIAYAASAGGNSLSQDHTQLSPYTRSFDSIGVREQHLKLDLLENGLHHAPELVIDPTFLISKYEGIASYKRVPAGKYIVSYEVSSDSTRSKLNNFIIALKNMTGLPVYHIGDKPISAADHCLLDISPSDWIGIVQSATLVCTNSFHGTALSLNFEKPLVFVRHLEEEKNARTLSLLNKTDLSCVAYDNIDELKSRNIWQKYDKSKLLEFIKYSQNFLDRALQ
ncbi:polysaccharide pyruvyl transferase family protein [Pseudomonas jessenii]|uniref:polysaccharide pyruvyl transferase family protein n=1 Tax=Pseudomonas jessenii TaxID=77298 RepID=UPI0030C19BD1